MPNTFTYVANGDGTATGGTAGALLSPMTVRCATGGQAYSFAIAAYVDGMTVTEFYEVYVTSSTNGDQVIVQDLVWLLNTR